MNALTFADLKERLGELIERKESSTLSYIPKILNEAYMDICNTVRFDFLRREVYIQAIAEYTEGTVAVNSQSTTVTGTGTTFTEEMIGRVIMLNEVPYRISGFTSTTEITIERPYEDATNLSDYTTGIFKDEYQLPYDCDYTRIWTIKDTYTPRKLLYKSYHDFNRQYPSPQDSGDPVYYIPKGYKEDRYPSLIHENPTYVKWDSMGFADPNFVEFGEAVGETLSNVDDYYVGWLAVNNTVGQISRVVKSVAAQNRMWIDPPMSGTQAGNEVALVRNIPTMLLYPYPDDQFNLKMVYYKTPNKMVDDVDVPLIPHRYHELIYWGAGIRSGLIKDDTRRREIKDFFSEKLNEMAGEYGTFDEDIPKRAAMDDSRYTESYVSSIFNYPLGD